MRIETKDTSGELNGYLVPLWNVHESPEFRPRQLTVDFVSPDDWRRFYTQCQREQRIYVLDGEVELHSKFCRSIRMRPGCWTDAPYKQSTQHFTAGHRFILPQKPLGVGHKTIQVDLRTNGIPAILLKAVSTCWWPGDDQVKIWLWRDSGNFLPGFDLPGPRPDIQPDQVYLSVVALGKQKGPHLHKKRCGRFVCIKGNIEIISRRSLHPEHPGVYKREWTGDDHGHRMIEVRPATAAALVNHGDEPAFVINMPSPAWRPDDQDEWPVEEWNP